jgi:hypothetical protein
VAETGCVPNAFFDTEGRGFPLFFLVGVSTRKQSLTEQIMSLGTILLIVLILILVGALPTWPHARSWGYGPSGIVGVILIVVVVLFLMGRL